MHLCEFSHSLVSFVVGTAAKVLGTNIRVLEGDTRSLDYGSSGPVKKDPSCHMGFGDERDLLFESLAFSSFEPPLPLHLSFHPRRSRKRSMTAVEDL